MMFLLINSESVIWKVTLSKTEGRQDERHVRLRPPEEALSVTRDGVCSAWLDSTTEASQS